MRALLLFLDLWRGTPLALERGARLFHDAISYRLVFVGGCFGRCLPLQQHT
jgi:hypothetical protein